MESQRATSAASSDVHEPPSTSERHVSRLLVGVFFFVVAVVLAVAWKKLVGGLTALHLLLEPTPAYYLGPLRWWALAGAFFAVGAHLSFHARAASLGRVRWLVLPALLGSLTLFALSVPEPSECTNLVIEPAKLVLEEVGATSALKATCRTAAGKVFAGGLSPTWRSSNPAIAVVRNEDVVEARAPGMTTLTAAAAGLSADASVMVQIPAELSLAPSEVRMTPGEGGKVFTIRLLDTNGKEMNPSRPYEWVSDNPQAARVDGGYIVAGKVGEATLTASWNGLDASAKVVVTAKVAPKKGTAVKKKPEKKKPDKKKGKK
jgi:hypothetical protein